MKKRFMAGIGAAVLVCSLCAAQAFAATGTAQATSNNTTTAAGQSFGGWGMGARGGMPQNLTDAQKAQLQADQAQRDEKLQAFVDTLSSDQKALYDAMTPAKPADGQQPARPDDAAMATMKANRDAFVASLTDTQKTAYDELFSMPGNMGGLSSADMETMKAQFDEKVNAFTATLTDTQKAAFEALQPAQPADGQQPAKPDDATMATMKANMDALSPHLQTRSKQRLTICFQGLWAADSMQLRLMPHNETVLARQDSRT